MGEYADDAVERMIWGGTRYKPPRRKTFQSNSGDFNWKTRNGVVSMYEMTRDHLKNAIELCEGMGNHGKQVQLEQVLKEKYHDQN